MHSLVAQMVKSLLQCGRQEFDPWVWNIPWRRKRQPTPVLLPGKSHGWRSLVGYSSWGRKELGIGHDWARMPLTHATLSNIHTKSHMLQVPRQKQYSERNLSQTKLLILERFPKRQEATGKYPGDKNACGSHLGEFISQGHWCWQVSFRNSLLVY